MIVYPGFDPIIFSIGPVSATWYGSMYLMGIMGGWGLALIRACHSHTWDKAKVDDLIFYSVLGVVLGGRAGYVLFYKFGEFLSDPLYLFRIWEGGMSFHGGLLGVALAVYLLKRKYKLRFFTIGDFVAPLVPLGLGLGRIGNFINSELWGRPTDMPWGMLVPGYGSVPLHPSQLYEALLEGLLLFVVVWLYSGKNPPEKAVSGVFLSVYGVCRFFVEFFRVPDAHLGYIAFGWLTQGQLLSLPMVLIGVGLIYYAYHRPINQGE